MPSVGTISDWIPGLKAGDEAAVQQLWERYFQRLVQLAGQKLQRKWQRVADAEDAALSALASFCRRAERGEFPDLNDGANLWSLVAKITLGKVSDYINRGKAKKRGSGMVRGDSALIGVGSSGREVGMAEGALDRDPTPAEAAEFSEDCQRLLGMLRSDDLRKVALLKADGYTREQIAGKLGTSLRTVARCIAEIRKTWAKERP
ncbi:MAG: RNA polymerase subunit sigma-70 [Planctomycetes bacterium]|nr:RNA polymerase subunit sigma-70 [Planctomycetota bacterium]